MKLIIYIDAKVDGVDKKVDINKVPKEEDGRPIKFLLSSETGGLYDIDIESYNLEKEKQTNIVAKKNKDEKLNNLTVTISSGKTFYADSESRIDLRDAIELAIDENQNSTPWKLAEEFNGERIVVVTLDELKEASKKAIQTKGQIVGAIDES